MALFALVGCGGGAATTGGTTGGASGGTTGGTSGGSSDSSIAFRNSSSWAIRNLYMSTVEQNTWGPDQLGAHVIHTGESYTITGIPCANYDLKLVDEDNDECIVRNVNVCAESTGVNITSEALLGCQAATRAQ
ncbi:MAG: hypothetical protein Q8Q09_10445 [Deltaproteobacteria bacterium]|nr:hypothetical protein [Deltaproteobacteria bacterium]